MKRLYILLSLLVFTSSLSAKIIVPDGTSDFFKVISQNPYAVVHYINYEQVGDDKLKEQALTAMKNAFAQSANESSHVLANIAFIGVNSRIAPDLISEVEKRDNLKKSDSAQDFSIVFLYNNGKPVQDATGYLETLTDAFDQADLGTFIEKFLGDYVSYQIKQAQARQAEAQRVWAEPARTVTRVVERPVYRYYDPYYYDDYYYYRRRPRFGFGIGWGGGWGPGWGWGRRGWWGPGFGFGVGF